MPFLDSQYGVERILFKSLSENNLNPTFLSDGTQDIVLPMVTEVINLACPL